jgi:putative drug exporter of the RND superfamily
MTEALARASSRHPWRTIIAWLVVVVLSFAAIGMFLGDALTGDPDVTTETESKRANALLFERFPHDRETEEQAISEVAILRSESGSAEDAGFRERVGTLSEALRAAGVKNVVTSSDDPALVSVDGDATALLLGLGFDGESVAPMVIDELERVDAEPGVEAAVTGEWTLETDFGQLAQDDLRNGELFFGAPAALIVLLLVFGAVVAGLVPLVLALMSIFVALALTALVGQAFAFSDFVQNMIFGMGLALGIDYSLFVLSRYREERSEGREKYDAIGTAGATASRAVLFSGLAFVLAMFGLLLVPNTIMRSLAAGAILVGFVSIVAALTLLPAVLGLLGDRVNALRLPYFGRAATRQRQESRFWGRVVHAVMRRPVASLALACALLIAAALPVLAIDTGTAGIATVPDRFQSKQGFLLLNEEFPGQTTDPVEIVVDGNTGDPKVAEAIARLKFALEREEIFGPPAEEVNAAGNTTHFTVPVAGDALSKEAVAAVRRLRSDVIPRAFFGSPAEAFVTGDTGEEIDYFDVMSDWLPVVFAFVLGLSFILLTVAFRSIVLPAKAILLNLLSVGAAYGLLVLVFVKGVGNELFGFQQVDTVEAWVPLFLFAVLFGLSMDYQVFLLSRIRERFARTNDNDEAISFGVTSTARLITGAALIIIAVFAGFARGELVMFQQMGFGVAVALLLDATIVRSVLVPASMKLLGRWNWYLPSWLRWLPDVHMEGGETKDVRPAAATR